MRIVKLTDVRGQPVYVDAEKFVGVRTWQGITTVEFLNKYGVTVDETPEAVLRILGLEQYVDGHEPESQPIGVHEHLRQVEKDRAAAEKTRTGQMGAGELKPALEQSEGAPAP